MSVDPENDYKHIRNGVSGFYEQKRGLIAVWGEEAVQFLDGLVTNDVKTLGDGDQMLAAFPNAQGRLLAAVRVLRQDAKFLIETEEATREKLFQNLFRFTFAGEFFVEDLSDEYRYLELFISDLKFKISDSDRLLPFEGRTGRGIFAENDLADEFRDSMLDIGVVEISDELFKTLRIEAGVPPTKLARCWKRYFCPP